MELVKIHNNRYCLQIIRHTYRNNTIVYTIHRNSVYFADHSTFACALDHAVDMVAEHTSKFMHDLRQRGFNSIADIFFGNSSSKALLQLDEEFLKPNILKALNTHKLYLHHESMFSPNLFIVNLDVLNILDQGDDDLVDERDVEYD